MKYSIASHLLLFALSSLGGTPRKGSLSRRENHNDDANNSRPAEGLQDAIEDFTKE